MLLTTLLFYLKMLLNFIYKMLDIIFKEAKNNKI